MAESFNKKEREKKRQKKKRDKAYKREQKKMEPTKSIEFMYVGEDGNLTAEKPDPMLRKKTSIEDVDISTRKQDKSTESKFSKTGIVKFFNTEKGYGFIDARDSENSYFVHVDNLIDKVDEGDRVIFEVGRGPKGPIATDVKLFVPAKKVEEVEKVEAVDTTETVDKADKAEE